MDRHAADYDRYHGPDSAPTDAEPAVTYTELRATLEREIRASIARHEQAIDKARRDLATAWPEDATTLTGSMRAHKGAVLALEDLFNKLTGDYLTHDGG